MYTAVCTPAGTVCSCSEPQHLGPTPTHAYTVKFLPTWDGATSFLPLMSLISSPQFTIDICMWKGRGLAVCGYLEVLSVLQLCFILPLLVLQLLLLGPQKILEEKRCVCVCVCVVRGEGLEGGQEGEGDHRDIVHSVHKAHHNCQCRGYVTMLYNGSSYICKSKSTLLFTKHEYTKSLLHTAAAHM